MDFFTKDGDTLSVEPHERSSSAPVATRAISKSERLLERRSYKRYRMEGSGAQPWCSRFSRERFSLVDLSFGGLSMMVGQPLEIGSVHEIRLDLDSPISDRVTLTVSIRSRRVIGNRWLCGAQFLKSSKAWLGPE